MKLYALQTDTKEWVNHNSVAWVTSLSPKLFMVQFDAINTVAEIETGHPCQWVEVQVLINEQVEELERKAFEAGWKACESYYGIDNEFPEEVKKIVVDFNLKEWKEEKK